MSIPAELLVKITNRLTPGNGPASAQDALRVWAALFGKLVPLLGPLGNELLFARSLALRQPAFPWLPRPAPGAESSAFADFRACLDGRSSEEILAANCALLEAYTSALADLVGVQLATRLSGTAFTGDDTNADGVEEQCKPKDRPALADE